MMTYLPPLVRANSDCHTISPTFVIFTTNDQSQPQIFFSQLHAVNVIGMSNFQGWSNK